MARARAGDPTACRARHPDREALSRLPSRARTARRAMAKAIYRLPRTDERYGCLCPRCAGRKTIQASQCRRCWFERLRGEVLLVGADLHRLWWAQVARPRNAAAAVPTPAATLSARDSRNLKIIRGERRGRERAPYAGRPGHDGSERNDSAPTRERTRSASPFLVAEEVAERLRCSLRTIHELVRTRRIPHRRLPGSRRCLFRTDELILWEDGAPARGDRASGRRAGGATKARLVVTPRSDRVPRANWRERRCG